MFKHRVARNRTIYFAFLFGLLALFGYLITNFHWELYQLLLIALIFLIPGRLVQFFWRDFFAGRKHLDQKESDPAIEHFEKFLNYVHQFPWIQWLVFFSYGLYSFKVEAMTLTYLAQCYAHKSDWNRAEDFLNRAMKIDSQYAMAFYNKAVVAALKNNLEEARGILIQAESHGYPKITFEEFLELIHEEYPVSR